MFIELADTKNFPLTWSKSTSNELPAIKSIPKYLMLFSHIKDVLPSTTFATNAC